MNAVTNNNVNDKATPLGIRSRLILGFSAITLIFMLAIGVTLWIVHDTKIRTNQVINTELPAYENLLELQTQVLFFQHAFNSWLNSKSDVDKKEAYLYTSNLESLKNQLNQYSNTWPTQYKTLWQDAQPALTALSKLPTQVEASFTNSSVNQAALSQQAETLVNDVIDKIDGKRNENGIRSGGISDNLHHQVIDDTKNINSGMRIVEVMLTLTTLIGIIAMALVTILTTKSIVRHINIFRQFSSRIASGDLRHHLNVNAKDEIGQLGIDLNSMNESLSAITKQITSASHSMVTSLEEVKQAVDTQSAGATEQASSINQITASLEEIEQSSAQTMEKAKALGEAAERTRETGQLGLNAVEQSIQGMKAVRDKVQMIAQTILDLSNQTQQVGEITSAVNSLAQQSKMLALNASIEAAKAGEAGKGFAVVASEVKNLAEQSEQSTAQVQKILEDIRHATEKAVMVTEEGTKGVDTGTDLVEQTGEIVKSLSDVIQETTIASQQIEAAVRQESVGIEQITAGMNEINQVTSSFVTSAKQTLEAINNLSSIAKNLKERVDAYKV